MEALVYSLTSLAAVALVVFAAHDCFRRWLAFKDATTLVVQAYEKTYRELRDELDAVRDELRVRVATLENREHGLSGPVRRNVIARGEVRP